MLDAVKVRRQRRYKARLSKTKANGKASPNILTLRAKAKAITGWIGSVIFKLK